MRKDTITSEGRSKSFSDSSKREPTHICELSRGSDSNLLKLQPTASICARIKRIYQKTIIVTAKHPATRFYLRSHAAIAFEKKRHGRSPNWWVIHPCSGTRFVWEVVMSFTYLYCFVVIPYIFAFYMLNSVKYRENSNVLVPAFSICLVDIVMNSITGYASPNSHEIFLDPTAIASHYIRGYFFIDLLSSIPYSWILQNEQTTSYGEANFTTRIIELFPLLKLLRLTTLRTSLNQFMQVLGISHLARLISWLVLFTALLCHWATCLTYGFPFFAEYAGKDGALNPGTWLGRLRVRPEVGDSLFDDYLESFYRGFAGLCSIDSSNAASANSTNTGSTSTDRIVTCMLLVIGMCYQMYLIIIALQLVESAKGPEIRYQRIMNNLKFYVCEKRLTPKMEKKLLNYYEYRFQDRYFKENVIIGSLADHLKEEILMHTCRKLMDRVAIFWNLQKPQLGSIITALKPEIYLRNDIIFKCEDEGNCMYFIGKGTLAVITYAGNEICHLEDGAYFGESSLLYPGFKRAVTVIALEECELFKFDRKDFKRLIPPNSDLYQRMRRVVKDQVSILVEIENEESQSYETGESNSNIFSNVGSKEKTNSEDRR